ncbi:MAG: hypothetical protein GX900_01640 [Clostridiaceae bacterium]|nr:hypothetical protein [Clostridiaceae bacterium]
MYIDKHGDAWYKCSLHNHTTFSDGKQTPAELVEIHRAADYDVLAISDHWLTWPGELTGDTLPPDTYNCDDRPEAIAVAIAENTGRPKQIGLLNAVELNCGGTDTRGGIYHILGLGTRGRTDWSKYRGKAGQDLIDIIRKHEGLAFLAHPSWSLNTPEMINSLRHLSGAEIYNTFSEIGFNARGDSSLLLDIVATHGNLLPFIATDDTHFLLGEEVTSFTWIKSKSTSRKDLLDALARGDFYASQGPRLAISRQAGSFRVECDPVSEIIFYTNMPFSFERRHYGTDITEHTYTPHERDTYLRVEIRAADGKRAWSNPLKI